MSKGSIRQKSSKWYYRFYIEDENGQHIQKEFVGSKSKKETEAMLRHTAIASVYFYFLFEKICFANT